MSEGLDSTDKLFMKHSSKSYNPKLANFFHERLKRGDGDLMISIYSYGDARIMVKMTKKTKWEEFLGDMEEIILA